MLCAVAKPTPPVIPGAQLKLDILEETTADVDRKELRQLWQDEIITYSCENTSLVLDHQVEGKAVSFSKKKYLNKYCGV